MITAPPSSTAPHDLVLVERRDVQICVVESHRALPLGELGAAELLAGLVAPLARATHLHTMQQAVDIVRGVIAEPGSGRCSGAVTTPRSLCFA